MAHAHDSKQQRKATVGWLTVSDTRTRADDLSGDLAERLLTEAGHRVLRGIEKDEPNDVRRQVDAWLADDAVELIVTSGGTGISARDRTYEALAGRFEQQLDGFGELFRMLSWEQVGSKAMFSRATAGVIRMKPIFLLPGSSKAVELALTKLILPEIPHLLRELEKHQP